MFSYETGQFLIVVLCCLIVIGFAFWLSKDVTSTKLIGKSSRSLFKKSVSFGNTEIKEFDSDED